MNLSRTGTVPILIVGATPAGVACALQLRMHDIPVTLVAEDMLLGGRAAQNVETSVHWPFGFSDTTRIQGDSVGKMLARAHALGAVIKTQTTLSQWTLEQGQASEVTLSGVLGKTVRRPRFIIVSSDRFAFLGKQKDHLYPNGTFGTVRRPLVSFKLRAGDVLFGEADRGTVDKWEFRRLSGPGDGSGSSRWVATNRAAEFDFEDGLENSLADALLCAKDGSEPVTLHIESTRWVRDAELKDPPPDGSAEFPALPSNVAFVGQDGLGVPMSIEVEVEKATAWVFENL